MAQKKSSEVDLWLKRPDPRFLIVLLYGPDRGLVAERGQAFANQTGLVLDDPFSVVKLDGTDVDRSDGRLIDEARTVPMFSSQRLLWVRNAGGQKGLADDIKALVADPPKDAIILVEAGELKKNAALRVAVETANCAMALPCYSDDARNVDALIDDELRKAEMTMALDARQALQRNLGGDRLASRSEIQKLTLYAQGASEISLDDVKAMTGDVSGQSFEDAVDAILDGRVGDFDSAFTQQSQAGSHGFLALASTMRQFQTIHAMRGTMDESGRNPASIIAAHRPPVFFARRKLLERALERWGLSAIERVLLRLSTAILQTRRRPELSTSVARQALLGIAIESSRLQRR